MILDKGIAPFYAMAELTQTAQPRNFMSQIYTKGGPHQIAKCA